MLYSTAELNPCCHSNQCEITCTSALAKAHSFSCLLVITRGFISVNICEPYNLYHHFLNYIPSEISKGCPETPNPHPRAGEEGQRQCGVSETVTVALKDAGRQSQPWAGLWADRPQLRTGEVMG